ncbi:hypothetical protein E4U42_006880 [Claviceps africana]|uniref:F-box domain-containing protein n=1 Tax=Claviceps africana TaxID=83212 RepID=A0A8K0J7N2_9HYPO|nr:hypothetical protein E4U42_006880 [Claviceps africana]
MSQTTAKDYTHVPLEITTSLFDVLHNSLILRHIAPYLPIYSLLQLSATSKDFQSLVRTTPGVFRHLDLTRVKKAKLKTHLVDNGIAWRNGQIEEGISDDDAVESKPLTGILSAIRQQNILRDVQTLILDGLAVSAALCYDIINDPSYSVRILSIREVKNLNHAKVREALQYACRPSRHHSSPRLKALYVFGTKEVASVKTSSSTTTGWDHQRQQVLPASLMEIAVDDWWCRRGPLVTHSISMDWIKCMVACRGLVAFDAVLCQGPRHGNSPVFGQSHMMADDAPAAATHAIGGCDSCGKAPEGLVMQESSSPFNLPLLSPVPIMASSVRAATYPTQAGQPFAARCGDCLRDRYCACCHKWWCETCYQLPIQGQATAMNNFIVVDEEDSVASFAQMLDLQDSVPKIKKRVSKSCWECGSNCDACISKTQLVCKKCCAGYCIIHNEGSSSQFCDWCVSRGRGLGRQDSKSARLKLTRSSIPADLIRRRMRDAVTRPLI